MNSIVIIIVFDVAKLGPNLGLEWLSKLALDLQEIFKNFGYIYRFMDNLIFFLCRMRFLLVQWTLLLDIQRYGFMIYF